MSENYPTNVQVGNGDNGTVSFATDVVATIAGLAATEVEGVASMSGGTSGLADILGLGKQNARNFTKGVRVEIVGNQVNVQLTIVVDYGAPVPEVAGKIQENIKKAIETMTGLIVREVNIHVSGVSFEKENRAAAELEERQQLLLRRQEDDIQLKENEALPAQSDAPLDQDPDEADELDDADDDIADDDIDDDEDDDEDDYQDDTDTGDEFVEPETETDET